MSSMLLKISFQGLQLCSWDFFNRNPYQELWTCKVTRFITWQIWEFLGFLGSLEISYHFDVALIVNYRISNGEEWWVLFKYMTWCVLWIELHMVRLYIILTSIYTNHPFFFVQIDFLTHASLT
jgi:hypothetical protein